MYIYTSNPMCKVYNYSIKYSSIFLYKLVAKVISNRLKVIMDKIISFNQLAFLLGRLISDNIIVSHECLA